MYTAYFKVSINSIYRILRSGFSLLVLWGLSETSGARESYTLDPPPDNIHFKRVFDGHDIAVRAVTDIVEDSQGFMWFGTERGLYRYDGYQLKKLGDSDNTDPITHITSLHIPKNTNDLWIGGYDRLIKFDLTDYSYVVHKDDMPNGIQLNNYFVTDINSTREGDVIFATGSGLSVINHKDQRQTSHSALTLEDGPKDELIWATFFDESKKQLWLGTNNGMRLMDWKSRQVALPEFGSEDLKHSIIHDIHMDRYNDLWLGSSDGLYRVTENGKKIDKYLHNLANPKSIGSNLIWCIFEDKNSNIWIGTDHGGLNVFDRKNNQFHRFVNRTGFSSSLSSNTVKAIAQDKLGNLWTGNFPTGVNFFSPSNSALNHISHIEDKHESLSHNSVLSLMEDEEGKIWIGTDGGGLDIYDPITKHFSHHKKDPNDPKSISSNVILSLLTDSQGGKWIGTYREGLLHYDQKNRKFEQLFPQLRKEDGSSLAIWALIQASDGKLWMGTQSSGVFSYEPNRKKLVNYKNNPNDPSSLSSNFVFSILEDSLGNMWFGTRSGVNLLKENTTEFIQLSPDKLNPKALQDNVIFTIYEDSDNRLWFGTRGGLSLLEPDSLTFRTLNQKDGLSSNSILSIQEDHKKNLWVGTDQGISKIDTNTLAIQNHRNGIGWVPGPYNSNAALKTRNNKIFFGSINGLLQLDPSLYRTNAHPPDIVFTDFKLFTESVLPNDKDGVLNNAINYTDKVILHHYQTMFSIEFAALDFLSPNKNQYAYKLEGFDKEWRNIGNKRTAVYTNIDPGQYIFRVQASNSHGVWNTEGISLEIVQLPPPWKTWWAYLMYFSVIATMLTWFVRQKTNKLKFERNLEAKSNIKLRQLDKLKSNFLANTSHELLTPLNGIIGLSQLLETRLEKSDPEAYRKVRMINASGKRLSGLVRDILDFTMISDHELKLNIEPLNLYDAVNACFEILRPITQEKSISLNNAISDKNLCVQADRERLRHILESLVSNGIKYTEKGEVTVSCKADNQHLVISVQDTGIGISPESIKSIFQAFDQVEEANTRKHGGAGLGLAFTQKLIELHGGSINVSSEQGNGSTFYFTLSLANNDDLLSLIKDDSGNISPQHKITKNLEQTLAERETTAPKPIPTQEESSLENKEKILIVDDDTINRIVLRGLLELDRYDVIEADSGPNALNIVEQNRDIALIVLDIMMPHMDGYEVCRRLRLNHPMHKLPIVFLTAKTTEEAFEDGMEAGGNDFLTKPTSKSILLPKISSLLRMSHET